MVNSLKSFLEVENQAMLPTKERMDKWASKRSPGSERIVGTGVVDTRMILEQRWEK